MMRHVPQWIAVAAGIVLSAATLSAQVSEAEIDAAIERGVQNVFNHQGPDGRWGQYDWAGGHHYPWGRDAIALLTLEFAQVDVHDERYQKGLRAILEAELEQNYERSCRTMVLARLTRRTTGQEKAGYRDALKRDVKWLEEAQGDDGGWTYTSRHGGPGRHDFSNSQMSVLALSEAIMAGIEVSPVVMRKAQELFLKAQVDDGGWRYALNDERQRSYGSMTAAAVATLFITRDYLDPKIGCPCRSGQSQPQNSPVDKAIRAGVDWLGKEFIVERNPHYSMDAWAYYWLYSVERVGLATGYRYLGEHNWYKEGAAYLVQRKQAIFGLGGQNFPQACLATLFLIKGKAPILYNKLRWDGRWDQHPRDLANLTLYLSDLKEQPLKWQTLTVKAPLEDWYEAPILYISSEEKIDLTDDQKEKLRRFTETGGTIFFEASCGNYVANAWWKTLSEELWPDYEYERIADEHPVWQADADIKGRRPVLYGLSDQLRTFVFLASRDISCAWSTNAVTKDANAFLFGGNLYMYATDRATIRTRFGASQAAPRAAGGEVRAADKSELRIARLKSGGDYYAGVRYRPLAAYNALKPDGAVTAVEAEPVAPSDLKRQDCDVVWLTGCQSAALSEPAAASLKAFLAEGGFLLAEATMGDVRFAKSFEELAKAQGWELKDFGVGDAVITGGFEGARGRDASKVAYSSHLKAERVGANEPVLKGIYSNGKLVGVYSPMDIVYSQTGWKAFGTRGYEADDARALLVNILILASLAH